MIVRNIHTSKLGIADDYTVIIPAPHIKDESVFMAAQTKEGVVTGGFEQIPSLPESKHDFWRKENGTIVADEARNSERDKQIAIKEVNSEYEKSIAILLGGYSPSEVSTFSKQESEAISFIADNTATTPFLDSLSTARGEAKGVVANRIIAKANAFSAAVGALTGAKQKKIKALGA